MEIGETTAVIGISTKTRSIGEKLAGMVVRWPGADTTQVFGPSMPVVVGQPYAIVILTVNTVMTTRLSKISCLGDPRMVTPGLAGLGGKTVILLTGAPHKMPIHHVSWGRQVIGQDGRYT